MLVLSRHVSESIIIDVPGYAPIVVMVADIRGGDKVRIGISADQSIAVHRREVWEEIQRQRAEPPPAGLAARGGPMR